MKKEKIVAVSGGFDPIHIGHVRLFEEARALGDKLIVILNNDNWLMKKKGYVFMPEKERAEVIKSLRVVDDVYITEHPENPEYMHVAFSLKEIRPDIFANGGDRGIPEENEKAICDEISCEMVFGIGAGGKVQSSSWLLDNFLKNRGESS